MSHLQLAVQFFLQIAVILAICQLVGRLARHLGQPQVVAEMIAGVLLGPSLLGLFWPELFARLFPKDSMNVLFPISQLGLATYMFVVGLEFRVDIVRDRLHSAVAVSIAGMLTPFVLGALLGWCFADDIRLFPQKTSELEAMIFLGASMCITAFPMLARIIHFKGLAGTPMGTVALGAGAMDDAAAWCLLAVVLALFDDNLGHAFRNIAGGVAYVAITLRVVKPLLARWARGIEARGMLSDREFVICLILMSLGGVLHGRHRAARGVWRVRHRCGDAARIGRARVDRAHPTADGGVAVALVLHFLRTEHSDRPARLPTFG